MIDDRLWVIGPDFDKLSEHFTDHLAFIENMTEFIIAKISDLLCNNSLGEPLAIYKNLTESLFVSLSSPSAILLATETAARRI